MHSAPRWLLCAVLFYPAWMAASVVVHTAPALLRAALMDFSSVRFQISETRIAASTDRSDGPTRRGAFTGSDLAVLGFAVAGLSITGRRFPMAAGLTLALIAAFALRPFAIYFGLRRFGPPPPIPLALVFLAVCIFGVYLVQRSLPAGTFTSRLLQVGLGVVLPATAIVLLLPSGGRLPFRWQGVEVAVLVSSSLAASFFPIRPATVRPVNWKPIAAGGGISVLLFLATGWSSGFLRQLEQADTQRTLIDLREPSTDRPYPRHFFQRGVSFTAESGVRYGSAQSRTMLEQLPAYGIDAIALIPFGFTRYQPLRMGSAGAGSWEPDAGLEILTALAHKRGIRVMLKPHIDRPSEAELPTEALRTAWFSQFGAFLEHYARLAHRMHADLFCVGVEFGWLTRYEPEWRRVIARVRAIYPGPLVYAANFGEEFETIRFWDALDYIGLDNYYPLPDTLSQDAIERKVEIVYQKFRKPVLFTEAGYPAVIDAHKEPWADEMPRPISLESQARAYEALLAAFYHKPWFYGVYWWKVGTNGYGGPENNSMTPWRKPAMDVLRKWYLGRTEMRP